MSLLFVRANSDTVRATNTGVFSGRTAFTVSFWIKHTTLVDYHVVFCGWSSSGNRSVYMYYGADGKLNVTLFNAADAPTKYKTGTADVADTWYHVVVTWDTTQQNIYYYRDGELKVAGDFDDTLNNALQTVTSYLYLGSRAGTSYYADARMEHVGIWDHVLTAEQISTMYKMRLRPSHPLFLEGLLTYWPLDRPKTGVFTDSTAGRKNACVEQAGGLLVLPASPPPNPEWSADSPGLNMYHGIPIRPADYGIETLRRRREGA